MLEAVEEFIFKGDVKEKMMIKHSSISWCVVFLYLLFVKWAGPAMMRNRKPFNLKYVMIAYDFAQVAVNGYLTYSIYALAKETWHARCMAKKNPLLPFFMQRFLKLGWQIHLVKYADLIDTCMFVLRKKDSQITFLHIFHHALMCLFCSWGLKNLQSHVIGFYLGFGFAINTSVHCIVYFYYALAAMGPQMNKYLWWKKYLTVFQMVQFTAILLYMFHGFATGCEELGVYEICVVLYVVAVYALFIDFYKKYKDD